MADRKPLSQVQLEQRRAAAKSRGKQLAADPNHQRAARAALGSKVDPRYWKF